MQATMNNRTYTMTPMETAQHTANHLASRGFEPTYYIGESAPVGRQRKHMTGMFVRNAKTGAFDFAF